MWRLVSRTIPHISIIISGMMVVFFIIDHYNKKMRFLEDDMTKVLILVLSLCAIATAIMLIQVQRKADWQRHHKEG